MLVTVLHVLISTVPIWQRFRRIWQRPLAKISRRLSSLTESMAQVLAVEGAVAVEQVAVVAVEQVAVAEDLVSAEVAEAAEMVEVVDLKPEAARETEEAADLMVLEVVKVVEEVDRAAMADRVELVVEAGEVLEAVPEEDEADVRILIYRLSISSRFQWSHFFRVR